MVLNEMFFCGLMKPLVENIENNFIPAYSRIRYVLMMCNLSTFLCCGDVGKQHTMSHGLVPSLRRGGPAVRDGHVISAAGAICTRRQKLSLCSDRWRALRGRNTSAVTAGSGGQSKAGFGSALGTSMTSLCVAVWWRCRMAGGEGMLKVAAV